ncbi:nuclear transport factor 2 family protein [Actinoplanes sp. NPDC051494]|uniref:nuclear transport factor 2 family protein n=1 Tax=Actinoplanes sp. NPDC051494 TaxID=3363907 RepID=UPI0037AFD581
MSDMVKKYLDIWNETDPVVRRAAIADVFAADVRYTDPLAAVTGPDGLDAVIAGVHRQFPGLAFTAGELDDAHHDQARFTWRLGEAVEGFDVITLDADGRISAVYGFLDRVPG